MESMLKICTVTGERMGGRNTDEGQEGGEIPSLGLWETVNAEQWQTFWYQWPRWLWNETEMGGWVGGGVRDDSPCWARAKKDWPCFSFFLKWYSSQVSCKLLGLSNLEEVAPRELSYFSRSDYKLDLGLVVLKGKHGICHHNPLSNAVQMTCRKPFFTSRGKMTRDSFKPLRVTQSQTPGIALFFHLRRGCFQNGKSLRLEEDSLEATPETAKYPEPNGRYKANEEGNMF